MLHISWNRPKRFLSVLPYTGVAAIGSCDKDISNTISMPLHKEVPHKNVQIGNDQEMAQSERNSHSTKFQADRPSANVLVAQTCCDLSEIVDDDGRRRGRTPDHAYIISSL